MPYRAGKRLAGERASRLGHLEVLRSDLVRQLCESFEDPEPPITSSNALWEPLPATGDPLPLVFGIDGSMQIIESDTRPHKALAFVKTALLRIDQYALSKIDKDLPHPFALRDILADSALYHATVFPLRHVSAEGLTTYDAIRKVIFDSIKDPSLDGQPFETLKWIVYEKWDQKQKSIPPFECPHCEKDVASLPYDAEAGKCARCNGRLYITDMLGFHQEMAPDSAPDTIATAYMNIHETLLLFTGIRCYWENNRETLSRSLFVKDGPLSIRAQYSKLVAPLRRFLSFASDRGYAVHIIGQEKSGAFAEHLELIGRGAPVGSVFVPGDKYIKKEIQHRPDRGAPYGRDTNYGAKVFMKLSDYHQMVLNIPTGSYKPNPIVADLIGVDRIVATIPQVLSNRYEGAILPIELAHGVASLSTYPSAHILKIFAETLVAKS